MNISINKNNAVYIQIAITVTKTDYQFLVKKSLNNFRKNAIIPGFRKGNVPKYIIQSIYGKDILTREVNKLVSDKLSEYIKKNELNVLLNPCLVKSNLDLDNQEEYEFLFDIWLQPNVCVNLTKCDELPYYSISVTDEMIEKHIDFIRIQYSNDNTNAELIEGGDIIKGKFIELNEYDIPNRGGINFSNVQLALFLMNDDVEKLKFIGKKIGDTVIFNPYKAFGKNKNELSFFLKIWNIRITSFQGNFSFVITEINRHNRAEVDQKLFDKLCGVGVVTSVETFKKKVKENLILQFQFESDCCFWEDVKQFLLKKMTDIKFPETFLKQYFVKNNFKISREIVEENFSYILQDVKIKFICNKIFEENVTTITIEDIKQAAKDLIKSQSNLFSLYLIPDAVLEKHVSELLKVEKNSKQLYNMALKTKIISIMKEKITLKVSNLTEKEFWEILK
ncbi:MAG: hypothetical protein LBC54_01235 [Bacteroidales bacterium OttesenSCG-928-I14]|jgi:trigger factor|nr:hypothetical protein [Bacteroidales bacterium OttesenSCG-928-I14]